ncbi:type I polyketide synthase [Engelhardtia mirabilis]|uniref:Phenolphthiocerol synthesis polyketide synthase type I Pks15/1 n=1 Tax=Engelhardtia mirabilis TaxID=2528011 RepID=A0A518BEP6_9BACT|nr:Phenolphthiocerol synthesis polyketide synthase type I Pks15/1 [Planctomycetes bacterium Pla133]QDU99777.1 Phenolphthiocerol synthesis polyketide synthase type I Pks15/1 [Planctomycetes bacterium Pla86]
MGSQSQGARRDDRFLDTLARAPRVDRRRRLTDWLCAELVTFLEFEADERIEPDETFPDLGFDSLRAVDFKLWIEARLDCRLESTLLFDCPTPAALVDYLALVLRVDVDLPPADATDDEARERPGDLAELDHDQLLDLARRQAELLRARDAADHEPIAIVGMACRFPGGADSPAAYWALQTEGRDAIGEVPPERWAVDEFFDPDPDVPGRMYTRWGGWIDGLDRFDAAFFGISPREAEQLDPQQRILLEVAWEALEHAGIAADSLAGTDTGVFIGNRGADYYQGQTDWNPEDAGSYYATGNSASTLAGRVSYTLGLTGPCFALDTACSSSLVALHQAVRSLRAGESGAALVGGVNAVLDPFGTISICKAQMLSADGRCKTFDAAADGYVRSEGCGVIVLKTLSRARADGDRILALVRGTAIDQDGASGGLTVPSRPGQARVLRAALADARVAPGEVDYVEAHGTGTSLGDPIEVAALDDVFAAGREGPLLVGSVKTNIGHCEPAAGMAGLIKLVLALGHEQLPRHLHLEHPNPHIDWERSCCRVTTEPTSWPRGARRRLAGVSSFGFSGTNAHAVLEEAPAIDPGAILARRPCEVLCLSARSEPALRQLASRHLEAIRAGNDLDLTAWCRTAATGREHFHWRAALVVEDRAQLELRLAELAVDGPHEAVGRAASHPPRVAFLFTGQGSQYAGMARELHATEPVFRAALERCEVALAPHLDVPLREVLFGNHTDRLARTDATQPALFAVEVALAELWRSVGVEPTWVLGHSVGEYAAAVVAGVMSLEAAAALVAARGRLMVAHTAPGAMVEVLAEPGALAAHLAGHETDLGIAAINCEARVVVSGTPAAIERLTGELDAAGHRHKPLDVSHAFHSPLMEPMLAAFAECARGVELHEPRVGFRSCLDPSDDRPALTDPSYWVRHVREPVRFHAGVRALAADGVEILLELGATPVLLGLARRFLEDGGQRFVPSLRQGRSDARTFAEALAQLHVAGVPIDWSGRDRGEPARRVDLPTYPFQRQRFWVAANRGARRPGGEHPLLGRRLDLATLDPGRALFETELGAARPAFIADHRAGGRVVFPGAGYAEALLAAGAALDGEGPLCLEGLAIEAPLFLGDEPTAVQVAAAPSEAGRRRVEFFARASHAPGWKRHASATVGPLDAANETVDLDAWRAAATEAVDVAGYYANLDARGLGYGPAFRPIRELHRGDGLCVARVSVDGAGERRARAMGLDPALLDGCLQTVGQLTDDAAAGALYLPVGIDRLELHRRGAASVWCRAERAAGEVGGTHLSMDLDLVDDHGAPVAQVRGLRLVRTDPSALLAREAPLETLGHVLRWRSLPGSPAAAAPPERWLLAGDGAGLAAELARQLKDAGAACERIGDVAGLDVEAWRTRLEASACEVLLCLWPLGERAQDDLCAPLLAPTLPLARALDGLDRPPPRLVFVTRGAVAAGPGAGLPDNDAATLIGLGATLELEQPAWRCTRLDLDPGLDPRRALAGDAAVDAERILSELRSAGDERQVAWRGTERFAARLVRFDEAEREGLRPPRGDAWRLRSTEYGVLERIECKSAPRRAPGAGEVEIAVEAAALNFKDVLFALGMLREFTGLERAQDQPLGMECAGRVVRVGPGARGLAPGDAVLASAPDTLASHVVVPASAVAPRPAGCTFAEAAGLPTVFMTALHSLERTARLRRGERVLIHAAAGGVGLAAIQVARRAGAELFATASRGKWPHLRALGVEHLFDSRSTDYADELLAATGGRGVEVVLDSLAGDHVEPSLRCLAKGGRLVEIGKLEVWTPERVAAKRPDVSYTQFDLADLFAADPDLQASLLADLTRGFAAGEFTALPTRTFAPRDTVAAFRALAQGRSIGKLAIDLGAADRDDAPPAVRGDRAYLISGGLGALGLHVARGLARQGAGELLLVGRRAPEGDVLRAVDDLRAAGAQVATAAFDIGDATSLDKALDGLALPLGGAVHAAGVLEDGLLTGADVARFERVLAPKLRGARTIAQAVDRRGADWFVSFSSMAAMVGSPGQSAYAAANAWLDAQSDARRARGAHGLAIAWGPWSGGGMASRGDERHRAQLEQLGLRPISPGMGLAFLLAALRVGEARLGAFSIDWQRWSARYAGQAPGLLDELGGEASAPKGDDDSATLAAIEAAPAEQRLELLTSALRAQLARVLGFASPEQLDVRAPFVDLGLDSLLAVDLRHRLESTFACSLAATLILDHPDVAALAAHLNGILDERRTAAAADDEALLAELAELSDEEVARLLAEERADG